MVRPQIVNGRHLEDMVGKRKKDKLCKCLIWHHTMEACDGMVFYIQSFMIMVIYTYIVCSASHLNRFTLREMPSGTD